MWELIRANKRNSIFLMGLMAVVLLLLGFIIGIAFAGGNANGGFFGLMIATVIWFILMIISFSGGDQILLAASRAQPVTHDVHPQLFNIVEEMKIAAGLPKMPKIYIINDPAPNAFATGRSPETASVAVTAGLLARLNRDELQGTADEVPDPQALRVSCRVNGIVKQDSNTRHMYFRIARIIAELSAGLTLEPGDVISTGTPAGVGHARTPPEFMAPGDLLETEVEGIGLLRNRIVTAKR